MKERPGPAASPRWAGLLLAVALLAAAPPAGAQVEDLDLTALEVLGRAQPEAAMAELTRRRQALPVTDPQQLELLRASGLLASRLGQPEQTSRLADELARWAEAQQDPALRLHGEIATGCLQASRWRETGPLNRADRLYETWLPKLPTSGRVALRLACLTGSAGTKESLGQLEPAIERYQAAIRLADSADLATYRSVLRSSLANALRRAGQASQAWDVNEEARRIAETAQDWLSVAEALTVRAILLDGQGPDAQELESLEQAIAFARRAGAVRDEALGLANLADYYLQRQQPAKALALAQQALPLSQEARYAAGERLARVNAGLALIALQRKDEGVRLVRQSIDDDRRSDEIVSMAETLLDLGHYLEQAGHLPDAYAAYAEQRGLADQVSKRERQHAMLELQERFEADRRQHALERLQDDNQLKEEQLREQQLRFRLWALVSLLAGGLLLVGGWLYRRMRRVQQSLERSHESLRTQSEQDPLTGLSNRRHGQALLQRTAQARGTLYLLDLDHFKRINDEHGHAAGDAVLVEVARRLQAVVRGSDPVVRWGGEEFLILLESAHAAQADQLAQRLLAALASVPVLHEGQALWLTTSIGYASFPLQPQLLELPWEQAIDLIDAAMYLAKTRGRNRAFGVQRWLGEAGQPLQLSQTDLEQAWREGRVALSEWLGPPVPTEAAA